MMIGDFSIVEKSVVSMATFFLLIPFERKAAGAAKDGVQKRVRNFNEIRIVVLNEFQQAYASDPKSQQNLRQSVAIRTPTVTEASCHIQRGHRSQGGTNGSLHVAMKIASCPLSNLWPEAITISKRGFLLEGGRRKKSC